jgi:hypothetical protein
MILHTAASQADLQEIDGAKIYIVRNDDLERLLFNRNLVGAEFRKVCLACSRRFMCHLSDEYDPDDTAELVILSKGLLYQLADAASYEIEKNLPTNLIATSRVGVSGDSAEINITYSQLEAPARTLLIGDTVASGATIVESLKAYLQKFPLERLYVLSFAGTKLGAIRIAEFCRQKSIDCTFLYGLAAFGLGDNGFDLSFLHPETVTRDEYRQRARVLFSGRPVSAVGWDFGSQAMAPNKYRHLCWVEAEIWGLQGSECFAIAQKPTNFAELAHERSAYAGRFDIPEL